MLEEGDQRDRGDQDPEEPPQLRQTGADRGLHTLQTQVYTWLHLILNSRSGVWERMSALKKESGKKP